ncbi:MAG: amidohydrolase family protein [Anaerolineae bacterium]|nr:amidohydrolase family protein [Anaerolineae bacterium]
MVDLEGYTIFPGLINAHDHLELNHYPRSKFREVYDNAHQWGEDMNARLDSEPYKSLRAYPLKDRLFIGGLKNLLCGATTVAHHGPPHKVMFARDFPVRVLRQYGWAHSLHFNTEQEVVESYRKTPKNWPWFIHLAEGTDDVAASEYQRLKALGCVGLNTVIVHGVGMTEADIADAASRVRGLVWCPTTNLYLLSKQPNIHQWRHKSAHVALGSDSILTAEGNLLDEIREGSRSPGCDSDCVSQAVSSRAASVLGMQKVGHLKLAAYADWTTASSEYGRLRRSADDLIVKDGIPRIGDPDLMAKFPQVQTVAATLDGVPKTIHIDLARRIHQCTLKEPGLEVDALPTKRFWLI